MIISLASDAVFPEKCLPTFNSPARDGIIEKWLIFFSLKLVHVYYFYFHCSVLTKWSMSLSRKLITGASESLLGCKLK